MDALILRFDAPLMSFGGVMVDQHNVTDRFPGLSLFAGLLANALGWRHGNGERIGRLQARLLVASNLWKLRKGTLYLSATHRVTRRYIVPSVPS